MRLDPCGRRNMALGPQARGLRKPKWVVATWRGLEGLPGDPGDPPTHPLYAALTSGCGWPAWMSSMECGLGTTFLVHAIMMTEQTLDCPLGKAGSQSGLWGIVLCTHMANRVACPWGRAAVLASHQPITDMSTCRRHGGLVRARAMDTTGLPRLEPCKCSGPTDQVTGAQFPVP